MAEEELDYEKWGGDKHPNDPNPNPVVWQEKLLTAWKLAGEGKNQIEIAKAMGCAQSSVSKYLKQARELFTPIDAVTEQQLWLRRWDELYSKVMAKLEIADGDDEKLIELARKLNRDRAWFTGTNAAKKLDITHKTEEDLDAELQEMIREVQAKNARKEQEARDRDSKRRRRS